MPASHFPKWTALPVRHLLPTISLVLCLPSLALQIRAYDAAKHARISNFPATPTTNLTFLNAGGNPSTLLDLTGVGWNTANTVQQFTLVSPRHFIGANHYKPVAGETIRFLARDNTTHDFTVAVTHTIPNDDSSPSDVFLGELTTEVPSSAGLKPLAYLNLATESAYVGQPLVVLGQPARGGRGTIGPLVDFGTTPATSGANIKTRAFSFSYGPVGSADDARAEIGDSGSPSLVIKSGQAMLVGTHTAIVSAFGTTTTYDTLVPHYASGLNAVMETRGYHLEKATPDVTTFTATGVATATVRAMKPFTFHVSITNGSAAADNVTASFGLPAGAVLTGTNAGGWFGTGSTTFRRGGMNAGQTLDLDLDFSKAPTSGNQQITLDLASDGSAMKTFTFMLPVTPSYSEWADGLTDPSTTADNDADGVANLLEYAFGGDPRSPSRNLAGATLSVEILPQYLTDPSRLRFLRRQDSEAHGLRQVVEVSTSLEANSWSFIPDNGITKISSPAPGFDLMEIPLSDTLPERQFHRIRVDLDER